MKLVFRRYSAKPEHVSPHYNRHRYRHILVAFSPGGILPLPFQVWLGFPDEILETCLNMGMCETCLCLRVLRIGVMWSALPLISI